MRPTEPEYRPDLLGAWIEKENKRVTVEWEACEKLGNPPAEVDRLIDIQSSREVAAFKKFGARRLPPGGIYSIGPQE